MRNRGMLPGSFMVVHKAVLAFDWTRHTWIDDSASLTSPKAVNIARGKSVVLNNSARPLAESQLVQAAFSRARPE